MTGSNPLQLQRNVTAAPGSVCTICISVCVGGKVLSRIKYLLTVCYGLDIVSAPNWVLNAQSFMIEFEGSTFGMQFQGDEVRSLEDNGIKQRGRLEVLVSVHPVHKGLIE